MTYLSITELKDRIKYTGDDFYDINPETKFEDLLTELEKESRGIINSYIGIDNETLGEETDRVDTETAPDNSVISLLYPVQEVKKVEIQRGIDEDTWQELSSDYYTYSEHNLKLKKAYRSGRVFDYPYRVRSQINSLKSYSNRITWRTLCRRVKVTYDRGYKTIPADIKSAQVKLVNNLLRNLRQEQNVAALSPEDLSSYVEGQTILTEDVKSILDNQTNLKHNVIVL